MLIQSAGLAWGTPPTLLFLQANRTWLHGGLTIYRRLTMEKINTCFWFQHIRHRDSPVHSCYRRGVIESGLQDKTHTYDTEPWWGLSTLAPTPGHVSLRTPLRIPLAATMSWNSQSQPWGPRTLTSKPQWIYWHVLNDQGVHTNENSSVIQLLTLTVTMSYGWTTSPYRLNIFSP